MNALLLDLDGVLYQGDHMIPGAAETLDWIAGQAIPHLFVTNTTSRSRAALVDKLAGMGIRVDGECLLTPAVAAAGWLKQHADGPVALFVPAATRADFASLPVVAPSAESGASAVVVGDLGRAWDFPTLNRAFRLLMNKPRPALVALGMTRYWQVDDGLQLDAGPFVAALAYASGVEPVVLGKPASAFFERAAAQLGAEPRHTVMAGDDIVGDIDGAQNAGLRGLLVRTGKFRAQDLDCGIKPHDVIESIAGLPDWWQRNMSQ